MSLGVSLARIATQNVKRFLVLLEPSFVAWSDREPTRKGKAMRAKMTGAYILVGR